jgi:hypothetical protein
MKTYSALNIRLICRMVLLMLCLMFAATSLANAKDQVAVDANYQRLVETLKKTPLDKLKAFPFLDLRQALFDTGREVTDHKLNAELRQELSAHNFAAVIATAEEILAINYTSTWAHTMKAYAHEQLKQENQGKYHRQVVLGVTDSILATGDGKTTKTAWKVLNIEEEYNLLRTVFEIFQVEHQSLLHENHRHYDILTAKTEKGDVVSFYFDITEFFNRNCARKTGKPCP